MQKHCLIFTLLVAFCWGCKDYILEENVESDSGEELGLKTYSEAIKEAETILSVFKDKNQSRSASTVDCEVLPYGETLTRSESSEPTMFIVNYGQENGYAVVAAQRGINKVLAFSENGSLSYEAIDSIWFLNTFFSNMHSLLENGEIAPGLTRASSEPEIWSHFKPLLKTTWSQGYPYNENTPFVDGEHAAAGCAPVAIAQVMAYYHQPATYRGYSYNWNSMLSSPTNYGVAHLISEVGHATGAKWGIEGSPVTSSNMYKGFQAFGYSNVGTLRNYDFSTAYGVAWEIEQRRPVIVCGSDEVGGHAWVVDGYMSLYDRGGVGLYRLVHCNWGWGGYRNGYYYSDAFNPGTGTPIYPSTKAEGSGDFTRNLKMLTPVSFGTHAPDYRVTHPENLSLWGDRKAYFGYSTTNSSTMTYQWDVPAGVSYINNGRYITATFPNQAGIYTIRSRASEGTFTGEWQSSTIIVGDFCDRCLKKPCECLVEVQLGIDNMALRDNYYFDFILEHKEETGENTYKKISMYLPRQSYFNDEFYLKSGLYNLYVELDGNSWQREVNIEGGKDAWGSFFIETSASRTLYYFYYDSWTGESINLK